MSITQPEDSETDTHGEENHLAPHVAEEKLPLLQSHNLSCLDRFEMYVTVGAARSAFQGFCQYY